MFQSFKIQTWNFLRWLMNFKFFFLTLYVVWPIWCLERDSFFYFECNHKKLFSRFVGIYIPSSLQLINNLLFFAHIFSLKNKFLPGKINLGLDKQWWNLPLSKIVLKLIVSDYIKKRTIRTVNSTGILHWKLIDFKSYCIFL